MKKRLICLGIICVLILNSGFWARAEFAGFTDVPADSWAKDYISEAATLHIMDGPGGGLFGYGILLTRAEFATMLPRLFGWTLVSPDTPTYADNTDKNVWYYDDIETALFNGAVEADGALFRPNDPITREEMAVMLIRALGYGTLAGSLKNIRTPFSDVTSNAACIMMANDFGIIKGITPTTFNPKGSATREVAATMMVRLYDGFYSKISWSHAFYAVRAYAQKELIPDFDAITFGWSSLGVDSTGVPVLNTTASGSNEYGIPEGYQEVVQLAQDGGVRDHLNVYMTAVQKVTLADGTITDPCSAVLNSADTRGTVIAQINAELQRENNYSGVTIDFEGMRGAQLKSSFTIFLQELSAEMLKLGMTVYVCVPPVNSDGFYYDGYDYKAIGECADKVILMAHDYAAKTLTPSEMNAGFTATPVSPIYDIYTALDAITDSVTGVQDKSKIALAISFNSVQWKIVDKKVINSAAYQPEPSSIYSRLMDPLSVLNYSEKYQNPYITYYNSTDKTDNIGWYEDTRSIEAKMELARMFGVTGISFWRLGLIPTYGDTADRQLYYDIPAWLAGQK